MQSDRNSFRENGSVNMTSRNKDSIIDQIYKLFIVYFEFQNKANAYVK